jgi:hypothetical protein
VGEEGVVGMWCGEKGLGEGGGVVEARGCAEG